MSEQPTPTPTPTEASPSTPSATPSPSESLPSQAGEIRDEEFAFLGAEKPEAVSVSPPPAATPGPAESRAAPGAPVVAQVPAPVAQPAAPVTPPIPQAPIQATPVAPVAPAAPTAPDTPEAIAARYTEHRQSRIAELANRTFQLDQTTVEQLQTEPEKVIPLLMAQSCMAAMEATLVAVSNYLPAAVTAITEQTSTVKKAESEFFEAHPELNKPEYRQALDSAGVFYRQLNPTATKERFIADVGAAVKAQLGIQSAPAPQAAPQGPRPVPHSPITVSAPRSGPVVPSNRFAALADDDVNDGFSGF